MQLLAPYGFLSRLVPLRGRAARQSCLICGAPHVARRLCKRHYAEVRAAGRLDEFAPRRSTPVVVAYALVDEEDAAAAGRLRWFATRSYGGAIRPAFWDGRQNVRMYHWLLGIAPSRRLMVDHINGDTLDNRRANLRIATAVENGQNRTRLNRNNSSGYRGVYRNAALGKWGAAADIRGKRRYFGYYDTAEEAAAAVAAVRRREMPFSAMDQDSLHESVASSPK